MNEYMASDIASQSQNTMTSKDWNKKVLGKKNKTYKVIVGFDKFIKYYYETPHGRCKADKIFLLPIYIIRFY